MSQLTRCLENYTVNELRELMEERGQEAFIWQVAAMGNTTNVTFLDNLTSVLGEAGIDELHDAIDAIDNGADPFVRFIETAEDLAIREKCAQDMEGIENIGATYARALRGLLEISSGIWTLIQMLKDRRVNSKWKGRRGDKTAIRVALGAAINSQAKEAAKARKLAKEEVDRLLKVFDSCRAQRNVEGMERTFNQLCNVKLRNALIKKVRSRENARALFRAYRTIIDENFKKKVGG